MSHPLYDIYTILISNKVISSYLLSIILYLLNIIHTYNKFPVIIT